MRSIRAHINIHYIITYISVKIYTFEKIFYKNKKKVGDNANSIIKSPDPRGLHHEIDASRTGDFLAYGKAIIAL